jgi:hypothetical protein
VKSAKLACFFKSRSETAPPSFLGLFLRTVRALKTADFFYLEIVGSGFGGKAF